MSWKLAKIITGVFTVLAIVLVARNVISNKQGNTVNLDNSTVDLTTEIKRPKEKELEMIFKDKEESNLTPEKKTNYIAACEKSITPEEVLNGKFFDEEEVALANDMEKLLPTLKQQDDMESDISYALISKGSDVKEFSESLKSLSEKYPESALVSYDLLSHCTTTESQCERSIIEKGIALDSQNGAVWLNAALYEIQNNNLDGAINALAESVNSPVYEEYWGEHITALESALLKAGAGDDLPAQVAGVNYAASMPLPNFSILVNFCENIELSSTDILQSCLSAGEKLADNNSTILTHLIGLSLQNAVYNKLDDEVLASQVSNERKRIMKVIGLSEKASNLTWQSSERTYDWLRVIKDSGELNATETIVSESIRLSSDPNFDPCEVSW